MIYIYNGGSLSVTEEEKKKKKKKKKDFYSSSIRLGCCFGYSKVVVGRLNVFLFISSCDFLLSDLSAGWEDTPQPMISETIFVLASRFSAPATCSKI